MSYQIFARKYRPQTLAEFVGQEHIITTLKHAIDLKRFAQSYLFVGPRGVGKTSLSRILAKSLNCINGPTVDPCGVCDSCIEIAGSRSLDVLEIDGASNNGVENIRDIRESVAFSPIRGPFKVYIIDEVHMLSSGAFNALLKTLEEPPSHVKFILATTEAHKLPATITSRCQRFDLRCISSRTIAAHLQTIVTKENIDAEEEALEAIASAAEGSLRDAEVMLDQAVSFCKNHVTESNVLLLFGLPSLQTVISLSSLVFHRKTAEALQLIAHQANNGCDLSRLLEGWITWLRDVLIQQVTTQHRQDFSASNRAVQEQAVCVSRGKLFALLELLSDERAHMKWTTDVELQMEIVIIKAVYLLEQANLDDVLTTLTTLRSTMHPPPVAARAQSTVPPCSVMPEESSSSGGLPDRRNNLPVKTHEDSEDAKMIWKEVTMEIIEHGYIRYGWLEQGQAIAFEESVLHVRFPNSFRMQFDSIFWTDIQLMLEKKLSKKRGVLTHLAIELVENSSNSRERVLQQHNNKKSLAISKNSAEDFRNDPLIRKALEMFKGTLQASQA